MNKLLSILFFFCLIAYAESPPVAPPSVSPAEGATVISTQLSAEEKKSLLIEFKKAKSSKEKALRHQERSEIKELQAAQRSQSKQWREMERKLRREFFDQHLSGPERRKYVQDYLEKKKRFDQSLKDVMAAKKKGWAQKNEDYKKRILEKDAGFKRQLDVGQKPSQDLWP